MPRTKTDVTSFDVAMGARFRELRLWLRPDLANPDRFGVAMVDNGRPPISGQTIRNWERGGIASLAALHRVCEFLGCHPREFYAPIGTPSEGRASARRHIKRIGFYGRPAHSTASFSADGNIKAACGVPTDAPNELAWRRWYDRIHPDDHARVDAELRRLDDPRDGVFLMQYRLLGVDGVERSIIDYGNMIFDSTGAPARLQGLMFDITDDPRNQKTDDAVKAILAAVGQDLRWKGLETSADADSLSPLDFPLDRRPDEVQAGFPVGQERINACEHAIR